MTTYLLIGLLSFLSGILVGLVLPSRLRLAGRSPFGLARGRDTGGMNAPRGPRRRTLLVLVALALAANALVGFLLIVTRATLEDETRQRVAMIECTEDYNRQLGESLAYRDETFRSATNAEIRLWRGYMRLFDIAVKDKSRVEEIQRAFYRSVGRYLEELDEIQATRVKHPYPDPEMCRRIGP